MMDGFIGNMQKLHILWIELVALWEAIMLAETKTNAQV